MSANQDKDQKVRFLFPNLKKPEEICANQAENTVKKQPEAKSPTYSKVIKAEDLNSSHFAAIQVNRYNPVEIIGKRIQRPESLPLKPNADQKAGIDGLKANLKTLNDLQARLRFMLKELEEIIKDES